MNRLLKIVVLWMMLLALPLQGFAAAGMTGMTCCGPEMLAPADAVQVDMTAAMDGMASMSMSMQHPGMAMQSLDHGSASGKAMPMHPRPASPDPIDAQSALHAAAAIDHATPSAPTTCPSCAAHCVSLAVEVALPRIDVPTAPTSAAIPFHPTPSTPFVPGTPERPPQPFLV